MRANLAVKPHVVYRAYNQHGVLLYVGCTHNLHNRLIQHRTSRAGWLNLLTEITVEHFPDGPTAAAAEQQAIRTEQPVFNTHATGRQMPALSGYVITEHVARRVSA